MSLILTMPCLTPELGLLIFTCFILGWIFAVLAGVGIGRHIERRIALQVIDECIKSAKQGDQT